MQERFVALFLGKRYKPHSLSVVMHALWANNSFDPTLPCGSVWSFLTPFTRPLAA